MPDETVARIDVEELMTKELHDRMLAMPPKDGFCRFYGSYVPVGNEACFPDGKVHKCVETEMFEPTGRDC